MWGLGKDTGWMAHRFFFTSIYPVLQKPCLWAPTLWFLFMQLNNESVWCSTWVGSPNWVRGSRAKMLSDFKKCEVHRIETKSCQSRRRSKWERKRCNRTPQEKWSDRCIFSTPMKWILCECIFFLKITSVTYVSGTKIIKFSTSLWTEEENGEAQVAFWLSKSETQTKPDKGCWRELLFPLFLRKTLHLSAVRDFLLRAITGWLTTITVCVSGKGKEKKKKTLPGKEPCSYHTLVIFVT